MIEWIVGTVAVLSTIFGHADADDECLALGVLDERRRLAFVASDPMALEGVYASTDLQSADARILQEYRDRGLRLSGMAVHRLSCRAVDRAAGRVVLDVVDRLGRTTVHRGSSASSLPTDEPTRRQVTLERTGTGWQVAGVTQESQTADDIAD